MAIELKNGVLLPDIPEDLLVEYPYAVIAHNSSKEAYVLLLSDAIYGHIDGSLVGGSGKLVGSLNAGMMYVSDGSNWSQETELSVGDNMFAVSNSLVVVWANHDIYEITSIDLSTGEYTTGDIYFSFYYKIRAQILKDIADALRFQKNSKKRYNVTEIADIMHAVAVLPSGEASATLNLNVLQLDSSASGILPTVYKGTASSTLDMSKLVLTTSAV